MRAALARGGVAVIVVPGEVFLADAPAGPDPHPIRATSSVVRPDEESLAAGQARPTRAARSGAFAADGKQPRPLSPPASKSSTGG